MTIKAPASTTIGGYVIEKPQFTFWYQASVHRIANGQKEVFAQKQFWTMLFARRWAKKTLCNAENIKKNQADITWVPAGNRSSV